MPVVGDPAQTGPGPDRAAARCGQWAGPPGFVLAASTKSARLASGSGGLQAGQDDRGARPAVLADRCRGRRVTAPQADQGIQGVPV